MKDAVTATMGRLIEIKHILVDLECSDYLNYNDILLDLGFTPEALKIPVPRHLAEERFDHMHLQRELLEQFGAKDFSFGSPSLLSTELSLTEAIKIIQNSERGRQGKFRAKCMAGIKLQAAREKDMLAGDDRQDETGKAVLTIQRVFRGYLARKAAKKAMRAELIFLGMEKPAIEPRNDPVVRFQANRSRRKILQQQFETDYLQALISTKEKLM